MGINHLRILAGVLATGGILWGLFCLPLLWDFDSLLKPLIFGPGYLATVGYFIRCLSTPSLIWRRVIWVASILVQGAWLTTLLWEQVTRQGFFGHASGAGLLILGGWWTFAFFVSVYGLVAESGTGDHQEPTSPDHSS